LTEIFIVCTINEVEIEFDATKDANNQRKHGVSLSRAEEIDWDHINAALDNRRVYSEDRYIAAAPIDGRLHVVVFTIRATVMRIISLRRANKREVRRYEAAQS